MSCKVKEAMYKFLDIFNQNGISWYFGENVRVVSEEILGICMHLDVVKALQEKHVMDVFWVCLFAQQVVPKQV